MLLFFIRYLHQPTQRQYFLLKNIMLDDHDYHIQVNKRCRFLLDFEKEVKSSLKNLKPDEHPFEGQDVDASSLGWAMSAVSSRAFRLHGKKLEDGTHIDVPMMLPLIDMCNHSFNPNAEIVQGQNIGKEKMLVKACSLISSFREKCIFYMYYIN